MTEDGKRQRRTIPFSMFDYPQGGAPDVEGVERLLYEKTQKALGYNTPSSADIELESMLDGAPPVSIITRYADVPYHAVRDFMREHEFILVDARIRGETWVALARRIPRTVDAIKQDWSRMSKREEKIERVLYLKRCLAFSDLKRDAKPAPRRPQLPEDAGIRFVIPVSDAGAGAQAERERLFVWHMLRVPKQVGTQDESLEDPPTMPLERWEEEAAYWESRLAIARMDERHYRSKDADYANQRLLEMRDAEARIGYCRKQIAQRSCH